MYIIFSIRYRILFSSTSNPQKKQENSSDLPLPLLAVPAGALVLSLRFGFAISALLLLLLLPATTPSAYSTLFSFSQEYFRSLQVPFAFLACTVVGFTTRAYPACFRSFPNHTTTLLGNPVWVNFSLDITIGAPLNHSPSSYT